MGKKKKINKTNDKTVKSVNNGIRSSVRKLNPILKSIVGKKLMLQLEIYSFQKRELPEMLEKLLVQL